MVQTATAERTRLPGLAVAGVTALVSGVSVFVNSYGVHSFHDAAAYTTAKNLVAAILLAVAVATWRARTGARQTGARPTTPQPDRGTRTHSPPRLLALAYVGVVGGGIAFVLFFEGLARTSPASAAFWHDTLVVWVAVLAWPYLRERLLPWNLAAIALLVAGEVVVVGTVGHLAPTAGEALVLLATVLWAVETVVAKRLLESMSPASVAAVRMGVGVLALLVFVAATGRLSELARLTGSQLGWVLLTGALLAAYVGTWMVALSRARALDVTSVLLASVVVTSLLELAAGQPGSVSEVIGLVLVALGTVAVVRVWPRRTALR